MNYPRQDVQCYNRQRIMSRPSVAMLPAGPHRQKKELGRQAQGVLFSRRDKMKKRFQSLAVKVNLLIMALVLITSLLMLASSEVAFQRAVFGSYSRALKEAEVSEKKLVAYANYFRRFIGTDELNQALAEYEEGNKDAITDYMEKQPPMDPASGNGSLLEDWNDFTVYLGMNQTKIGIDMLFAQIDMNGRTYTVGYYDSTSLFLTHFFPDQIDFGYEEEIIPPGDYSSPAMYDTGEDDMMVRCIQFDLDGGDRLNLWLLFNMTDEYQEHRQFILRSILFILGLTVLASVVSMLLLRRYVTRPVKRLALSTKAFVPEEDGTYSPEKICRDEIRSNSEIGELSRDIRAMQESIVENTTHLARMTAEKERVSTEMKMAAEIQANALPRDFPAFPERTEFSLCASMTPARDVGGDFYDFFLVDDDHLALVIADVSDKGVPAALFMMVSKALIKTQLLNGYDPAAALDRVNQQLCGRNTAQMFVTVWLAVLEISTGKGLACNGGHEHPALRRAGGEFELIEYPHDLLVGVLNSARYHNREFELHPGDCLFVYTDGVPEAATDSRKMFGNERLTEALNACKYGGPEEILRTVKDAVDAFVGDARQFDDLTMMCLEYKGKSAEQP